jgi:hypothetical protein
MRQTMKTYGGSGRTATPSLISSLGGGEWSASHLGRFTDGESARGTHWMSRWVGLRVGLDDVE